MPECWIPALIVTMKLVRQEESGVRSCSMLGPCVRLFPPIGLEGTVTLTNFQQRNGLAAFVIASDRTYRGRIISSSLVVEALHTCIASTLSTIGAITPKL